MILEYQMQVLMREKSGSAKLFIELGIPGRLVHIVRSSHDSGFLFKEVFMEAREVSAASFGEIKLSPSMFDDHLPDNYMNAALFTLKQLKAEGK